MSDPAFCFEPLRPDLVPSACRLSTQAGWNQGEEDWFRLLRLSPDGVRVWLDAGEVRASYSVVGYGGRVAWIGMILADCDYRGRGLGKAAFDGALETARAAGYSVIGLDATDMGEPIYRKFGFESLGPIVRWRGTLVPPDDRTNTPHLLRGTSPGVLRMDAKNTGEDRAALLHDLAGSADFVRIEQDGETQAFAAVRPGRTARQIGPVVARSTRAFCDLLRALAVTCPGEEVLCDVLRGDAAQELQALGMSPARHLQRMTLPRQNACLQGENVWFAAGFEWG